VRRGGGHSRARDAPAARRGARGARSCGGRREWLRYSLQSGRGVGVGLRGRHSALGSLCGYRVAVRKLQLDLALVCGGAAEKRRRGVASHVRGRRA
jgi:hypothetical protein